MHIILRLSRIIVVLAMAAHCQGARGGSGARCGGTRGSGSRGNCVKKILFLRFIDMRDNGRKEGIVKTPQGFIFFFYIRITFILLIAGSRSTASG